MKSIKTKISGMAIGITIAVTVVLLTVFFLSFSTMVNEQMTLLDTTLRESFDRTMRWEVESAEELAASAESLSAQAETLRDTVSRFKV
ncbi:MAG TPA: hypothetical protein PKH81_06540 [Treponemataceae bacterium]|nr:hypothetical protein [Treponemataceae bacterium]